MGQPADANNAHWWIDRSGQVAAFAVLGTASAAWVLMLALPTMRMAGMTHSPTAVGAMGSNMSGVSGPVWTLAEAATFLGGWALMMAAMMLPSATPMIALFNTVSRSRAGGEAPVRTMAFAFPYVALWALTGVPVYLASVLFGGLARNEPAIHSAAPYAVGAVLLIAGGYQFSPLKQLCLSKCNNPIGFLAHHWQPGNTGAARMGGRHASYCLGCCTMLMIVLVTAGSMGLVWVLLIAAAVLAEKIAPPRFPTRAFTGIVLAAIGMLVFIDPSIATWMHNT